MCFTEQFQYRARAKPQRRGRPRHHWVELTSWNTWSHLTVSQFSQLLPHRFLLPSSYLTLHRLATDSPLWQEVVSLPTREEQSYYCCKTFQREPLHSRSSTSPIAPLMAQQKKGAKREAWKKPGKVPKTGQKSQRTLQNSLLQLCWPKLALSCNMLAHFWGQKLIQS